MTSQEETTDAWRILLFGRNGEELLLLRCSSGFRLPELHIPRCQRIAPHLNAAAKRVWKLDTSCLRPLDVPYADFAAGNCRYHVMELCRPAELARVAPGTVQMSALKENCFKDPRDYAAVRRGMGLDEASGGEECCGPFSEFGAFEKISTWVEEQLQSYGQCWNGNFRQLQATASFALIRFTTNGSAVWFKAVGPPNLREFPVTTALAARFPMFLPELRAARTEWNAWLTAEVEGRDLSSFSDPAAWCRAAESLADLQIASIDQVPYILAAGARDVRSQKLLKGVVPFFAAMHELMEAQTKTVPLKLNRQEIHRVQEHVVEALLKLQDAGIPDSLNHLDLNPGNVLVSPSKCTFLDWAEAAVGNPFFSREYLRQHVLQAFPDRRKAERDVCQSYLKRWRSVLAEETAETLSLLAPLTAAFAFAACALPWDDAKLSQRPELAAYFRSLLRRMYRESEQIRTSRAA